VCSINNGIKRPLVILLVSFIYEHLSQWENKHARDKEPEP